MLFKRLKAGRKTRREEWLAGAKAGGDSGDRLGKSGIGWHKEDVMKKLSLIALAALAMLVVLPFAAVPANAQVAVGIGVGPAVGYPAYYGPPDCEWGYYAYYPYACAPYGYYGPDWFAGGIFIGAGPWYGRGWGRGGWGYRGGYG